MPITVPLGLSNLDKTFFGFRKVDRSLITPILDGKLSIDSVDVERPPELPPLGALTWSNTSFTKLFEEIEPSPTPKKTKHRANSEAVRTFSELEDRMTSPVSPIQQHETVSPLIDNMEFGTLKAHHSSTIPERQQSSTSTTSLFKRSDSSSAQSNSSRSSVEDSSRRSSLGKPLHIDTSSRCKSEVSSAKLKENEPRCSPTPTSPLASPNSLLNTNKPLPPAPSKASRHAGKAMNRASLPELDSTPAYKDDKAQYRALHSKSALISMPVNTTGPTRKHITSQSLKVDDVDRPNLPRRNSARLKSRHKKSVRSTKKKPSIDMADPVKLQIFMHLVSISDVKSVALVNKSFYRVFKRHESTIVEEVLRRASPPAWELRQLVKREQKRNPYKLRAVQRDLAALRALQAFIMMRCNKLCRESTLKGLSGENLGRRAEIEDALWRTWTFCKLFGKGTSRDVGVHGHVAWLEGNGFVEKGKAVPRFGSGHEVVSTSELEDMSEMWRCMESLMSGFKGREFEAKQAGIFEQCVIDEHRSHTETQYLEDWIYDILSVGPKAVLTMVSCSFEHARVLGVTKWTPPRQGRSRRTFLKAALEQVYRDRLVEDARLEAEGYTKSMQQLNVASRATSLTSRSPTLVSPSSPTLRRSVTEASRPQPPEKTPEPPALEIRPDCDPMASLTKELRQAPTVSPTSNPASYSSLAMMSNASARLGATLFPIQHTLVAPVAEMSRMSLAMDSRDSIDQALEPRVVDPTDRAVSLLVKQLGFPEKQAKQALAMSDDGSGIDVQRAVELLTGDRRLESSTKTNPPAELADNLIEVLRVVHLPAEDNNGTRRPFSVIQRKRSNFKGLITRNSFRQSLPLGVIMDREDEDSTVHQIVNPITAPPLPLTMPTIPEQNQPEKRTGYQNLTDFIRHKTIHRSPVSPEEENSFFKGHRKSSSTGTIDHAQYNNVNIMTTMNTTSPVSPMTPQSSLGGCLTMRPFSEYAIASSHEPQQNSNVVPKPKVTLTRVGTGRKPSKKLSLLRNSSRRQGEQPEIIGYTY